MSDTSLNILIVDDDALLRMSLGQMLTLAGYNVRSADGGEAALCEIERETPDLLLSDLNMPGMSGFELLSLVRGRFPGIPVIAMSGAYFGEDVPPGVFADAFYEKGRGGRSLMQIVGDIAGCGRSLDARNGRHLADAWDAKQDELAPTA
jgi:CheY-like chemotaxis protein